ncbi:MAG: phage tail assembly protein [Synergistes sp.]|nr:phage tail assembly protein [Synergistes sp.]
MQIELSKEIEFEGKKYSALDLNLDSLTGKDVVNAESEAAAIMGRPAVDLDKIYQACVAARAAGVSVELLQALPARDFCKVTMAVQGFLLGV